MNLWTLYVLVKNEHYINNLLQLLQIHGALCLMAGKVSNETHTMLREHGFNHKILVEGDSPRIAVYKVGIIKEENVDLVDGQSPYVFIATTPDEAVSISKHFEEKIQNPCTLIS